jgi:hypothetical protein
MPLPAFDDHKQHGNTYTRNKLTNPSMKVAVMLRLSNIRTTTFKPQTNNSVIGMQVLPSQVTRIHGVSGT